MTGLFSYVVIFRGDKMNLTVNNFDVKTRQPQFKGALDGALTGVLRTLDTNDMANAVLIDLGAMVLPRTYYDAKNRNKDAGFETFFREISGTFINCLSAGIFAAGISHFLSNKIIPETKLRANTWYSDDSVNVLTKAWNNSDNNTEKYIQTILKNITGQNGDQKTKFENINWEQVNWVDEKSWNKIKWRNRQYQHITETLKTENGIIDTFKTILNDKNLAQKDKKNILKIMEARITNALGANRDLTVEINGAKWNDKLEYILRDTYDMGKDIFTNKNINIDSAIKKVTKLNKIKIFGALTASSALGLTNQAINRKLTEKRTGKKGFVGDVDYTTKAKNQEINKSKYLTAKKVAASLGMIGMVLGVMKVKNPKDFVKKLQFTGPVTSGNAIKTVYAANIVGRFMAADNDTELRESVVRDYFGFLNWLVFGGFAAKGVANLLDKNRENLFNTTKKGKGLKHWLNNVNLKTHAEIAAKGQAFAKKNIWKLNVAHASGLLYSAITLGYLLPMLNDKMTKNQSKTQTLA